MGRRKFRKGSPISKEINQPWFLASDLNRTSEAVSGESSPRQKHLLQLIHRSLITAEEVEVRSQGTEASQAGLGSAHPLRERREVGVTAQLRPHSSLASQQACRRQPSFLGPSRDC